VRKLLENAENFKAELTMSNKGFHLLADLEKLPVAYQGTGIIHATEPDGIIGSQFFLDFSTSSG
jgi:hypothetical protein